MITINWNPPKGQLRLFGGLWLPLFLSILAALWLWRDGSGWLPIAVGMWSAAVVISIVGWLAPQLIRPIFLGMTLAAFPIGWVVSHLLLAVIYFGIMTPLNVVMRLCGRDPLHRQFDKSATTYWTPHRPPRNKSQYFRQY